MPSVIFWRGPSQLTGEPILALANGTGSVVGGGGAPNVKTGAVVQVYILRSDMSPIAAVKTGADRAICGSCAMRGDGGGNQRACYVNYFRAPQNIWKGLHGADEVAPATLARHIAGEHVRLGAYGDPAAVPLSVWLELLEHVEGWTGYSHAWRTCDQALRALLMASVDSPADRFDALRRGWRTFRVRSRGQALDEAELVCPASAEAGHRATCQDCGLCRGLSRPAKSVAIYAHGSTVKWFPSAAAAASEGVRAWQ